MRKVLKFKEINQKGHLLIEILIAVLIAALIVGAVSSIFLVSLKSGDLSEKKNAAISLAQEGMTAAEAIKDSSWHSIYLPPDGNGSSANKGDLFPYYIYNDGFSWNLSNNVAHRDITVGEIIYSRIVYIYNVNRNSVGDRQICTGAGICLDDEIDDPSTQKIKIVVSCDGCSDTILTEYFTRWKNEIFIQSNWLGGSGQADFTDHSRYYSDDGNIINNNPAGSIKLKP